MYRHDTCAISQTELPVPSPELLCALRTSYMQKLQSACTHSQAQLPDSFHGVVQATADTLQDCWQQPLGALQAALACFGNAHGQGARDVGLLLEGHFVAEALPRPYLQAEL